MTLQQVIDKFKENDWFDKDLEAEFRKNDCDGKKLVSWEGHLVEHFLRAAVENIARVMIAMKCMCIDSCICYDMCVCVLTLLSRCSSRHASSSSIHRPQTRRECCHGCRRAPHTTRCECTHTTASSSRTACRRVVKCRATKREEEEEEGYIPGPSCNRRHAGQKRTSYKASK
jgi:hypothetical protein